MGHRTLSNFSASLALCVAACGGTPDEELRTLVGDGNQPVAKVGATESVRVSFAKPSDAGTNNLDVILTPDNRLLVKRYSVEWRGRGFEPRVTTERAESLVLPAGQAADMRSRVTPFRPPQLNRDGPFLLPKDCGFISDGSSQAVVAFYDNHEASGLFVLQAGCDNDNAKKLAEALRDTVAALPPTRTAASYN